MASGKADSLAGKVMLVTGAGRGIGREIALHAAAAGAAIVVNDLGGGPSGEGADSQPAAEVAAAIAAAGGQAVVETGSVAEIFVARKNEIFLMSQPRPIRSLHRAEGWTVETLAEQLLPAFRPSFYPLERSADVFCWDPV